MIIIIIVIISSFDKSIDYIIIHLILPPFILVQLYYPSWAIDCQ